jgi:hypothetical protein
MASDGRIQIRLETTTSTGYLERDIFDMVSSQTDTFGNLVVVEVETCLRKEGEASC